MRRCWGGATPGEALLGERHRAGALKKKKDKKKEKGKEKKEKKRKEKKKKNDPPNIEALKPCNYTSSARTSRGRKFPKGKELYSKERICL